jgi:hypothetical protein
VVPQTSPFSATEERQVEGRRFAAVAWTVGSALGALWTLLGTVLALVGTAGFGLLYALVHGRASVVLQGAAIVPASLVGLALIALLFALHELIHGLAMRAFGARPTYGAALLGRVLPVFFTTAEGHRFTRAQFLAVALAPLATISLLGALLVTLVPATGWLVVPLGIHLGGCVGDLWLTGLTLSQPRGTLVEDHRTGVVLLRPLPEARPAP